MFATCAQCFARKGKKVTKEQAFRIWYDAKLGTKSKSLCWEAWQAAWTEATWQARKPEMCVCEHVARCNLYDRCCKQKPTTGK